MTGVMAVEIMEETMVVATEVEIMATVMEVNMEEEIMIIMTGIKY